MSNEAWNQLKPYLEKRRRLGHLLSILSFDIETTAPIEAIEEENDLLSFYSAEYAAIEKDPEFIELVKKAKESDLNQAQSLLIDDLLFNISYMEKLPIEKYMEWQKASSKCMEIWKKAKNASDWSIVEPYFEKLVQIKQEEADLLRQPFHKTRYDALLSQFEKNQTQEDVDAVFIPLKKFLIDNLPAAINKQVALPEVQSHEIHEQQALAIETLKTIGYDLSRGVLRETEHPFSDSLARNDARVTTHYYVNDWRSSLFSVIHEGGHAIQFQNWPASQYENFVAGRASAALCETHSRFYENIIGRSKEFAPILLNLCKTSLKNEFLTMDNEVFYGLLNHVERSLVRTEADEFTYCLHIIIRYELERDLINGTLSIHDVRKAWNAKYKEYLGVDVPNDALGVLQDVHWFGGSFGYFPSYALGNLYGAQIKAKMKQDIPFEECLASNNLKPILDWLREKDFAYDYLNPKDWIIKVTGEEMNPEYFVNYLKEKFL